MSRSSGRLWLTRSYNFIDKDPEIDRFRTLFQKDRIRESDLAVMAGLAVTTVKNMFGGETRRPQHATFAKMAGALGYTYELSRDVRPDYTKEIPKARKQYQQYRELQAQQRERGEGERQKQRKAKRQK